MFAGGVYVNVLEGVYVSVLAQSACLPVCTPTDTDIHASCQHVAQNACLSVCTLTDTDCYHSTHVHTPLCMCVSTASVCTLLPPRAFGLAAAPLNIKELARKVLASDDAAATHLRIGSPLLPQTRSINLHILTHVCNLGQQHAALQVPAH